MTPPQQKPKLGFRWSLELDPVATLAFLLAIIIPVGQWAFSARARVEFFGDQRVLTMLEEPQWSESKEAVFLFHMSYFNHGNVGYEAVIRNEALTIRIGDREYDYQWWKCVSYDFDNMAEKQVLQIRSLDKVSPFVVGGKSAEQHISYFVPRASIEAGRTTFGENTLSGQVLLEALKARKNIEFELRFETAEQGATSTRYRLVYDSQNVITKYIELLELNDWRTFILTQV